jgi:hypothetical protein
MCSINVSIAVQDVLLTNTQARLCGFENRLVIKLANEYWCVSSQFGVTYRSEGQRYSFGLYQAILCDLLKRDPHFFLISKFYFFTRL